MDGEADMMLVDKWFKVKNGDVIFIPKGTLHAVNVTSRRPLKVFAVQAPESDDSDTIFR
ncbi:MAG: cupin domain-containing protein [Sphingobacteriales bacterium JAD_PAG50586_3]|nr:MAG: cupin domain-containing protein [Sphingobacteriales bacterium JAD_PAG50586_3]